MAIHKGGAAEPLLAAWGIATDGKPHFVGLAPGAAESYDAWHGFLSDLVARVKVIGRLPGERSSLTLVWAVLDRASRGWRGMEHTPATTRQLAELRHRLMDPPVEITAHKQAEEVPAETVTAVA